MAKKMVLVPVEMLKRLQQSRDTTPLTDPLKEGVVRKMGEIRNIANDSSTSDETKAHRYRELYSSYTPLANKFLESRVRTVEKPMMEEKTKVGEEIQKDGGDNIGEALNMLPKTLREAGRHLLNELRRHPGRISWDDSSTVSIDGKVLRGSNISDLLGYVLRTRKSVKSPAHTSAFLHLLASINTPDEFVRNDAERERFRTLKTRGERDYSSDSLGERAASSSLGLPPPIKRKRVKRKSPWLPYKS